MSTFTIDNENDITVYAGTEEAAQAVGSTVRFRQSCESHRVLLRDEQKGYILRSSGAEFNPGRNVAEEVPSAEPE